MVPAIVFVCFICYLYFSSLIPALNIYPFWNTYICRFESNHSHLILFSFWTDECMAWERLKLLWNHHVMGHVQKLYEFMKFITLLIYGKKYCYFLMFKSQAIVEVRLFLMLCTFFALRCTVFSVSSWQTFTSLFRNCFSCNTWITAENHHD